MFLSARLELLLQDAKKYANNRKDALAFLGQRFRTVMSLPDSWSNTQCGASLIKRHLLVHVEKEAEKLEALFHMARKLYSFVQGRCVADNADALSSHELLLPGHLLTMFVKEKIDEGLQAMKLNMMRDVRVNGVASLLSGIRSKQYMEKCIDRCVGGVGSKVVSLLSTGNIVSSSGLDLMQVSGFTVVAERLNALRYMSHFRAVHRGQFFTTMKTTTVRKLLPESWGFLCPVHTPDGGPCGLLQHLALKCLTVAKPAPDIGVGLKHVVTSLGVTPSGVGGGDGQVNLPYQYLPVLIDGVVVGGAPHQVCARVAEELRLLKGKKSSGGGGGSKMVDEKEEDGEDDFLVEPTTEIAWVPPAEKGTVGAYPGLYLFTKAARMIRPVVNLKNKKIEMIGPLEQVYLEVYLYKRERENIYICSKIS
jgi:DNA-directed RNA polymerase I subunit RPA2